MRLRKKLSIAGVSCFFMGFASMVISTVQNRNDDAGLFELFALVFLVAAIVLTLTAFIMKKLRMRRKHHRSHAAEERTVMKPYTETEGYGEAFSEDAEAEAQVEAEAEPRSDEHVYQVYTMVPKRPKGKKRRPKKDR